MIGTASAQFSGAARGALRAGPGVGIGMSGVDRRPPECSGTASRPGGAGWAGVQARAGRLGRAAPTGAPKGRHAAAQGPLARDALAAARESDAARRKAAGRTPLSRRGAAKNLKRRRWSGSGPDARDPQPLSSTLRTWVAGAGAGADLTKATIFGRWPQIVGADIADHCAPVSLVDGELLVQAESTAWATQIRMLSGQLVRRIRRRGGGTVGEADPGPRTGSTVLEVREPARLRPGPPRHLRLTPRTAAYPRLRPADCALQRAPRRAQRRSSG